MCMLNVVSGRIRSYAVCMLIFTTGSIWTTWQMAVLNAIIFVGVAGVVGYYSGLFSPENVPEFVISPKEMYQIFPSLAPPVEHVQPEDAEEVDLE